jgi:hypothetical protein
VVRRVGRRPAYRVSEHRQVRHAGPGVHDVRGFTVSRDNP